jgi:SAM-dependent methyltransferase
MGPQEASPWVLRFAGHVPKAGPVLDLACGGGRHARLFLARGHPIIAIDRDLSGISDIIAAPGLKALEVDLEDGRPFPLAGQRFAGVVVTNYLYRPLIPALIAAVAPGGVLIYETFARGNERFGRPRNPDHLAKPGELLEAVRGNLRVIAFEDMIDQNPKPAARQRICALNEGGKTI